MMPLIFPMNHGCCPIAVGPGVPRGMLSLVSGHMCRGRHRGNGSEQQQAEHLAGRGAEMAGLGWDGCNVLQLGLSALGFFIFSQGLTLLKEIPRARGASLFFFFFFLIH